MRLSKETKDRIPSLMIVVILIFIWQIAAMAVNIPHILPSPTDIILKIWDLRASLFLHHFPVTLATIGIGWAIAIAIGVLLASAMHFSEAVRAMIYPVLIVTQTIPVMCISPLFVLWFGYTLQAKLMAVVLSTFFAIALNTLNGLDSTDKKKAEWMKTCGASRAQIFMQLEVPTALPKFVTALKMTLPWAVIDSAVAEWLGATEGLGYFSKRMISKMDGAAVFAPVVILCVTALAGMMILKKIDKKYITWRSEV